MFALSCTVAFHENSQGVACCSFGMLEIRILTPSRFKNQTNDTFKVPSYNCNHQQGFLKQKLVTLHCCGFNLKFPKHLF